MDKSKTRIGILVEYLFLLIYLYFGAKILMTNSTNQFLYLITSIAIYIPIMIAVFILSKRNDISLFDLGINKENLYIVEILFIIYVFLLIFKKYNNQDNFLNWIFFLLCTGVSEEIIFRGYFYERLKKIETLKIAKLVNGVLFAFMHLPPQIVIRGLDFTGMLKYMNGRIFSFIGISIFYCILKDKYKTIYIPILLHSIFNYI